MNRISWTKKDILKGKFDRYIQTGKNGLVLLSNIQKK